MSDFVVPVPEMTAVPVVGGDSQFPVRRIYCVGRNYAAHIREMGGDERSPPFFFQKPRDAIVANGSTVPYPTLTKDLHHEIELVIAIGKGGKNISLESAANHAFGLAVGIDLTRRDVQIEAREAGRPWGIGKAFDHSAPINGESRQDGDLAEMIWSGAEVISILSTHYELFAGDLIFTGTPAGVGPVTPGDRLVGKVDGLPQLQITIGD